MTFRIHAILPFFLTALCQPVCAQRQFLDEGHLDVNWVLDDGVLFAEYLDDEESFPPLRVGLNDAVMLARDGSFADGEGSRAARLPNPVWDVLGVDAGDPIWLFPDDNFGDPILEPGFATDGVPFGSPDEFRIDLDDVVFHGEGEGFVTLYTNINTPYMATSDGIDGDDFYVLGRGDHQHMWWAFTAPGIYEIHLTGSFENDGEPVSSEPQRLIVAVAASPMDLWLLENGVEPSQLGDKDSPAGDGVPNLLKYALGLPPLERVEGALVEAALVEHDAENFLVLDLPLNPQAEGIAVRVETSADLVNWEAGAGHTVVLEHSAERIHVRDAVAVGDAGRRFIRLAVERDDSE